MIVYAIKMTYHKNQKWILSAEKLTWTHKRDKGLHIDKANPSSNLISKLNIMSIKLYNNIMQKSYMLKKKVFKNVVETYIVASYTKVMPNHQYIQLNADDFLVSKMWRRCNTTCMHFQTNLAYIDKVELT